MKRNQAETGLVSSRSPARDVVKSSGKDCSLANGEMSSEVVFPAVSRPRSFYVPDVGDVDGPVRRREQVG
jgi:hypothetical protein